MKFININYSNNAHFPITIEFELCVYDDYEQRWKCKATRFNDNIMVNFFFNKMIIYKL